MDMDMPCEHLLARARSRLATAATPPRRHAATPPPGTCVRLPPRGARAAHRCADAREDVLLIAARWRRGITRRGPLTKNRRPSAPPAPAAASPWFTRPHRLRPLGAGFAPRAGLSGVGRRPLRLPSSSLLLPPVPAVPPVAPAHPPVHPPVHRPAKTAQRPAGQARQRVPRVLALARRGPRPAAAAPPPDRRPTAARPLAGHALPARDFRFSSAPTSDVGEAAVVAVVAALKVALRAAGFRGDPPPIIVLGFKSRSSLLASFRPCLPRLRWDRADRSV